MSTLNHETEHWAARLDTRLVGISHLSRYHIVSETESTQETARQIDAQPGTVILAGVQTGGRGRYGRAWADSGTDGLAMSIVLEWKDAQRLAIATAIGVVDGLRAICNADVKLGIKWPNDVLADRHGLWKKVSGILVEQAGERAIIGIGINVRQRDWPDELKDRAVSLHQLDCAVSRYDVIESVLAGVSDAITLEPEQLRQRFAELDTLAGASIRLQCAGQMHAGRILSIDPLDGLRLQPDNGSEPVWCPAHSTTLAC